MYQCHISIQDVCTGLEHHFTIIVDLTYLPDLPNDSLNSSGIIFLESWEHRIAVWPILQQTEERISPDLHVSIQFWQWRILPDCRSGSKCAALIWCFMGFCCCQFWCCCGRWGLKMKIPNRPYVLMTMEGSHGLLLYKRAL